MKLLKYNEFTSDVVKAKPTHNNCYEMIYRAHGVSLRHLQGYLNWIVFKRHMSFKVDKAFWKSEAYRKVMKGKSAVSALTIHHKPFPISFEYDTDDTIYNMA